MYDPTSNDAGVIACFHSRLRAVYGEAIDHDHRVAISK